MATAVFLIPHALVEPCHTPPRVGSIYPLLVTQTVKRLPAMWETWVQSLGREDLLEKEMATHSSILAWKIPWMEEPGRLPSMGSQRVWHDWAWRHISCPWTRVCMWLLWPIGYRGRNIIWDKRTQLHLVLSVWEAGIGEISHDAMRKPKLAYLERPHGETYMENWGSPNQQQTSVGACELTRLQMTSVSNLKSSSEPQTFRGQRGAIYTLSCLDS